MELENIYGARITGAVVWSEVVVVVVGATSGL